MMNANKSNRYSHRTLGRILKTTAGSPALTFAIALILLAATGLAGCGLTAGALVANPGRVDFGNVLLGTTATQTVTLSNLGSSSLIVATINISGSSFGVGGLTLPLTLPAGKTFTFQAKFAPKAAGQASGALGVVSSASNVNIPLSGAGMGQNQNGQLTMNPSSVSFGNVTAGTSSSQTIQLSNSGSGSLTINQASASGTGFSISGLATPVTLAAGQSTTFNAAFAPPTPGSATGSISFADSNAPNGSIALSGTGVTTSLQLTANPSGLNFGNVTVGNSSTQSVNLTNTGNSNVTVQQVNSSGTGFSTSNAGLPVTLTAGQSVMVNVVFAPLSAGSASGSLSVASTASNSPTVGLSGTGVQTVTHSAALSWDPSTSTVSGYNVYRGTQSGGPYARVNGSLDGSTAYTDGSVQSATTYFYVITAVDSSGNESAYSNEAAAVIP